MAGHVWDGPGWWGVATLALNLFAVAGALALVLAERRAFKERTSSRPLGVPWLRALAPDLCKRPL